MSSTGKIFGKRLGRALGIDENEHPFDRFGFQDTGKDLCFSCGPTTTQRCRTVSAVADRCLIVISAGFRKCLWAILRIASGIVAEKSAGLDARTGFA